MMAIRMLTLISSFSAAVLASATLHEEHRAVSIESDGTLSNIAHHDQSAGSRVIAKSQASDSDRIDVNIPGMTLMDGITSDEAFGLKAAGIMRRDTSSQRSETGDAASEIEAEAVKLHGSMTHKAKRTTEVSWAQCEDGECKCASGNGVVSVIRYERERELQNRYSGTEEQEVNLMTNWHYRSSATSYASTPKREFDKGFTTGATDLQACGGDHAFAKDCLHEPVACTFDTDDKNPYDAKPGQYCCSHDLQYCSYKCEGEETFKCPMLTSNINFPGGMDPAGPTVAKRCYMAQYKKGLNPESSSDADIPDR